ncbi:MAG: hypothetical protein RIU46_08735 [Deltaproteobacteria bacterium]|jgi:hypothetical protein
MRNRVYRSIEGRSRGLLGFGAQEAACAALTGVLGFWVLGPAFGLASAVGALGGLLAWRRSDGDRSDYVQAARRRWLQGRRVYRLVEADAAACVPAMAPSSRTGRGQG